MAELWILAYRNTVASLCRFRAKPAKTKTKSGSSKRKELFRIEFFCYGVKFEEDIDFVHPRPVCQSCSRYFYRLRSSGHLPESHSLSFTWEPHSAVKKMKIVWMSHSHQGIQRNTLCIVVLILA